MSIKIVWVGSTSKCTVVNSRKMTEFPAVKGEPIDVHDELAEELLQKKDENGEPQWIREKELSKWIKSGKLRLPQKEEKPTDIVKESSTSKKSEAKKGAK